MRVTALAAVFILFSFNAHSMNVEDAKKYCTSYASNGYQMQSIDDLLCANTLKTLMDMQHLNCMGLRQIIKKRGDEGAELEELTNLYAIMLSYANDKISIEDGVRSFLDWGNKNPGLGKTNVVEHAYLYLSEPFPCKPVS